MNYPNEVRQILLRAKAELAAGWMQGAMMRASDKPGVCLYGAIVRGAGLVAEPSDFFSCGSVAGRAGGGLAFRWTPDSPMGEAVALLSLTQRMDWRKLALWNDAPGRTAADVVDLIDRALETLPKVAELTMQLSRPSGCGIPAIDNLDLRRPPRDVRVLPARLDVDEHPLPVRRQAEHAVHE